MCLVIFYVCSVSEGIGVPERAYVTFLYILVIQVIVRGRLYAMAEFINRRPQLVEIRRPPLMVLFDCMFFILPLLTAFRISYIFHRDVYAAPCGTGSSLVFR